MMDSRTQLAPILGSTTLWWLRLRHSSRKKNALPHLPEDLCENRVRVSKRNGDLDETGAELW
jgi:hypothetical protein